MRSVFRVFLCATVLAGGMTAAAQEHIRSSKVELVPAGKVRQAKVLGYIHHRTGKLHLLDGQQARGTVAAFDNLSAPPQDPNLGLNIAPLGPVGPNQPGPNLLCKYPVTAGAEPVTYYGAYGNGDEDCAPADQGPYYTGLINDPQDIMLDKYLMDTSVTGTDPNEAVALAAVTQQVSYNGVDTGVWGQVLVLSEANDTNGNGQFDIIDGVTILTLWDPNTPAGLYTIGPVTLDPNAPLMANTRGRRTWDGLNDTYTDVTLTTPVGPACSFGSMMTGGNPQGLFVFDPNCAIPQDVVAAGTVDEPNIIFIATTDSWQWFNDTQGEQGAGFDPNFPVNAGFDGDPNSVSYLDIINTGEDVFWVFFFPGGNELDISVDTAHKLDVAAGGGCPGDLNGDGSTNITDLGIVLANFGLGAGGDVDGDGDTDITDLGIVLANFGCSP